MNHPEVMSALHEQVGCYRRLARLAELQHLHVQQNQTEALLEVLQSRQQMLDRITELEAVIAPAKRNWNAFLDSAPAPDRGAADALVSETRTLLEQITTADRYDVMVLQQRKFNLGRQIRMAQSARAVNQSYGTAAYGIGPSSMDVQR
jgi:hypothetical protein